MKLPRRILNILFWSVVSAAFIGPGTVTTAAKSGALFGTDLLWVLLFSTLACLLLQESASRITILSGKNIGEIITERWKGSKAYILLLVLIILAICGGAAAYEMGNLIGAREGIILVFPRSEKFIIPILGLSAMLLLLIPSLKIIARFMGMLVMVLGILFLYSAIKIAPPASEVIQGLFIPSLPGGGQASWLALALIGTTIVPYNLFLGSGISKGEKKIADMRWGLAIAILLGGLFSMAVIIVGSVVEGEFSFRSLAEALTVRSGINGKFLLGIGLFAAGFTSAVTAPLASAITMKSLLGKNDNPNWNYNGIYFRLSWLVVLLTGMTFGMLNIKPIPAIILAQAMNGLILPLISFILVFLIHDIHLTGKKNHPLNSAVLGLTLLLTLMIGLNNLAQALGKIFDIQMIAAEKALPVFAMVSFVFTGLFYFYIFRVKRMSIK